MRKIVPLNQISAGRHVNTIFCTSENGIEEKRTTTIKNNYHITYDAERGILSTVKPNGEILQASGFETRHSIGVGLDGFKGNGGKIGQDGQIGRNGLRGQDGPRGLVGLVGYDGPRGQQGQQGPQGPQGPIGQKGRVGDIGLQGFQGTKGPRGPKGYRGNDEDFYIVFSENEPENPPRPGNIWHKLRARNYSAAERPICGGQTPNIMTRKFNDKQRSACWRLAAFECLNWTKTYREYLIDVLSSEYSRQETGPIEIEALDGNKLTFDSVVSSRVWQSSTLAWHDSDPALLLIEINKDTFEYTVHEYRELDNCVPRVTKDDTIYQVAYYDRTGNCPGLRLDTI